MKIISHPRDGWTVLGAPQGMAIPVPHDGCTEEEYRIILRACAEQYQYDYDHGYLDDIEDTYEEKRTKNKHTSYPSTHKQHMVALLHTMANPASRSVLTDNLALAGGLGNHEELIYLRSAAKYVCEFVDRIVGDTQDSINYVNATRQLYPVQITLPNGDVEVIQARRLSKMYCPPPIDERNKLRQQRMHQAILNGENLANAEAEANYENIGNGENLGNAKFRPNGESNDSLPVPTLEFPKGSPQDSAYGSLPSEVGTEDMDRSPTKPEYME